MKRTISFAAWVALALALTVGAASAQNCSGQPAANTVCAGPASGGAGLPSFRALVAADYATLLSSNNTWTGNNTFAPTSGNAITITTPSGFSKAISATQTGAGTDLSGNNVHLNDFNITNGINTFSGACGGTCGAAVIGERVALTTTGASNQGAAVSFLADGVLQAARTGGQQWTGGGFWTNITTSFSSGGTGTSGALARGSIIPFYAGAQLFSGATNYLSLEALEIGLALHTGASTSIVTGIWGNRGGDAVMGAVTDCTFCVVASGSGGQWGVGLQIGDMASTGFQPVASTGTLIAATAVSGSPSVAKFIDFSAYACSSNAVALGSFFTVDCSGNTKIGTKLQIGGTTASFAMWKLTGTSISARLADDSIATGIIGSTLSATTSVVVAGSGSGQATISAQATAGTPTLTLPNASGTFAVSGTSPIAVSATTGAITCATCTTSAASLTANQLVIGSGSQGEQSLGSLGTTTTLLHGNAGGAPSFSAVVSADLNITTTTCTNQFVTAISAGGVGTCTTDVLASAQHANQGTTTTVLHGNAAGNPSFAAVSLTADVTGTLGVGNGGTGTATTFTQGSVVFAGASGVYSQDNSKFFYDGTNHRLCIGLTSCGFVLTVQGVDGTNAFVIQNTALSSVFQMRSSSAGAGIFDLTNNGGTVQVELRGDTTQSSLGGGPLLLGLNSLTLAGINGELGFTKVTDPNTAPGAGTLKLTVVAGTAGGSCKIVARAGTSNTAVTVIDNVGTGC